MDRGKAFRLPACYSTCCVSLGLGALELPPPPLCSLVLGKLPLPIPSLPAPHPSAHLQAPAQLQQRGPPAAPRLAAERVGFQAQPLQRGEGGQGQQAVRRLESVVLQPQVPQRRQARQHSQRLDAVVARVEVRQRREGGKAPQRSAAARVVVVLGVKSGHGTRSGAEEPEWNHERVFRMRECDPHEQV